MTTPTNISRRDHLTFKGNLRATRYGWLRLTPAYSVHQVAELPKVAVMLAASMAVSVKAPSATTWVEVSEATTFAGSALPSSSCREGRSEGGGRCAMST